LEPVSAFIVVMPLTAAVVFGAQIDVFNCSTIGEIDTAFASLAQAR